MNGEHPCNSIAVKRQIVQVWEGLASPRSRVYSYAHRSGAHKGARVGDRKMSKVAKFVAALTMTASIAALGATTADAQRRNRDSQAAAPAAPATPQVSRAFATAYTPVQTAQRASDWAAADAALPAARAAAVSEYEKYLVARSDFSIATGQSNLARQAAAATAMLATNAIPAAEQAQIYTVAAQMAYNSDDYANAATRAARAIELGATGENLPLMVIDSNIRANQLDQAMAAARAQIARAAAAGGKAPENIYAVVARALQEARRGPEMLEFIRMRLDAYPTPANFRQATLLYLQEAEENRGVNIDMMRLLTAAGSMSERRFFVEYASSLAEDALPNEVLSAIAAGRAANLITPRAAGAAGNPSACGADINFCELETAATANLAEDRASLGGAERRAVAAPEARLATRIGDAYLAYENWAKAEELYAAALTKTGADADLLNTRIGISRYRAGNHAGALDALGRVQGAQRSNVARYWEILVRTKMTPAAVPAATPAPTAPTTAS